MTHAGATTMGAEGNLEGRLSLNCRAISLDSGAVSVAWKFGIDLGVLSTLFFCSEGAVTNGGTSIITGNIGTNGGAISGYDLPTIFNGLFYTRRYNKHFISNYTNAW
jgi:hypothetical protein